MTPDESGLFQEQIHFVDRKMQLGLTKISWQFKGAANAFIHDCLTEIEKVQSHTTNTKNPLKCAVIESGLINAPRPCHAAGGVDR